MGKIQIQKPTKKEQGIYGCSVANHLGSDVESSPVLYAGNAYCWNLECLGFVLFWTLNSGAAVCMQQNNREVGLKPKCLDPIPRGSDTAGLGWSPRMCIFDMSPGYASAAGLRTTLWKQLLWSLLSKNWELMRQGLIGSVDSMDFSFLKRHRPAKESNYPLKVDVYLAMAYPPILRNTFRKLSLWISVNCSRM